MGRKFQVVLSLLAVSFGTSVYVFASQVIRTECRVKSGKGSYKKISEFWSSSIEAGKKKDAANALYWADRAICEIENASAKEQRKHSSMWRIVEHFVRTTAAQSTIDLGDMNACIERYTELMQMYAGGPRTIHEEAEESKAYLRRSYCHAKLGMHNESLQDAVHAAELDPLARDAFNNISFNLEKLGRKNEADSADKILAALKKAFDLIPQGISYEQEMRIVQRSLTSQGYLEFAQIAAFRADRWEHIKARIAANDARWEAEEASQRRRHQRERERNIAAINQAIAGIGQTLSDIEAVKRGQAPSGTSTGNPGLDAMTQVAQQEQQRKENEERANSILSGESSDGGVKCGTPCPGMGDCLIWKGKSYLGGSRPKDSSYVSCMKRHYGEDAYP